LHLVITLNGETIKKVEPHLGYIHRSIEKMDESLSIASLFTAPAEWIISPLTSIIHGCCLCVEKGLQVEIPARAQVIRVADG